MTDKQLLARIETQAAEIAALRGQLQVAQEEIAGLPARFSNFEQGVYQNMARAAVNCGRCSGCYLAKQRIK